jgi:hypothetical protein
MFQLIKISVHSGSWIAGIYVHVDVGGGLDAALAVELRAFGVVLLQAHFSDSQIHRKEGLALIFCC